MHALSSPPSLFSLIHSAQLCLDLDSKVNHGTVEYLQPPVKQNASDSSPDAANTTQSSLREGYPEGSIANVSCEEGYKAEGSSITCHNGNWSGNLPQCISESLFAYCCTNGKCFCLCF